MKNREKFAKEIIDVACKGGTIAVTKDNKVVDCDEIPCGSCIFDDCDKYIKHIGHLQSYGDKLHEWAESEYVESKPTITSREKNFLDAFLSNCIYIARDINNDLYIYYNKPRRNSMNMNEYWITDDSNCFYVSRDMYGDMFNFIKWEGEPWCIDDLKKLEVIDE